MTLDHVVDEAPGEIRVGSRLVGAKHHVVDHRQGSHQFSSGALGQQRAGRIGDFDHQQAAGLARLPQEPNMFREQRIEIAGYPADGVILQPLLDLVERDDFRSGVQKQSLTVMCRFGAWACLRRTASNGGRSEAGC